MMQLTTLVAVVALVIQTSTVGAAEVAFVAVHGPPLMRTRAQHRLAGPAVRRSQPMRQGPVMITSDNFIDRAFRLARSVIGGILLRIEDPEKLIEQAVTDMQSDLGRIKQSYAEVTSTQRRGERQREALLEQVQEWERRAQLAVSKGRDDMAREALQRRVVLTTKVQGLDEQLRIQKEALLQLRSSMRTLEGKILEARSKKEQLIARARTAKTAQQIQDMLGGLGAVPTSLQAFERMRERVEALEAKVEVSRQMSENAGSLEEQFLSLEFGGEVEEELLRLKQQQGIIDTTPQERQIPIQPLRFSSPETVERELIELKRAKPPAAEEERAPTRYTS
ncbi:unnamed protein product [Vitrella brassicaformis CCMP3155]|uniref:PspA/IM30 family protein n=1 Tax=Vitrella brassicaformis (strain CCMP3155) TaxID=1169540 RepID=A0A0G4EQX4_VITBC|nr:unnamed protein product [Vitrella brassicaformis CCMP3155]|mmetsp:Transcript_4533/g.12021  ORF Transcript_4533/g.12021 Transcript_4533/m.12021 type:complete len:336 (-) Transcript_4533:2009-3016(-)|eukprot:CEL99851.1 unnamed protein product [Vitrella brassicaformis CCMP3155]